MNWYTVHQEEKLNTPALLIHPNRVESNIRKAIRLVGSPKRLRPHVKTNKMLEVGQLLVKYDIEQFKCATIAEAEMMAIAEAKDVLIAYQLLGPRVNQLAVLKNKYPNCTFSSLVDCVQGVKQLQTIETDQKIDVFIDIDCDHHRTGIPPGSQLDQLIVYINNAQRINLVGFHVYDGHANSSELTTRTDVSDKGMKPLLPYLKTLPELKLVAGGSPSFMVHSQHTSRQCSPGTFVFWDHGYQSKYPEYQFDYAAVVATRVISKIDIHTFCFDLGHKHIASEGKAPQVAFFNTPPYQQMIHSEEHLVIKFEEDMELEVGDILYGVPRHICPTVALYPHAEIIQNNEITDRWNVLARNLEL